MGLKTHGPIVTLRTILPYSCQVIFVHERRQKKKSLLLIEREFCNTNEQSLLCRLLLRVSVVSHTLVTLLLMMYL